MRELDPKNLIVEAKRGNAKAFDELYRRFFTPVFRYLYARTWSRELAEDLAQTAFVKAYAGIAGWRDQGKEPLAYFFTIARNVLADHWREKHFLTVTTEGEDERVPSAAKQSDEVMDESLSGELLKRTLRELSEDQCEVMTLRYFGELEYHEIAEATGKQIETVRQIHSRALKCLREKIIGI